MTFALPWLLGAGVVAMLGLVALHFIARDLPPVWLLPTARFVPVQRTSVLARAVAPRDPWLLLVRLLALGALATAAAQPAWRGATRAYARVIVADLSRASADRAEVVRRAHAEWREGDRLIAWDTAARVVTADSLSVLAQRPVSRVRAARLSSALLVALAESRTLRRSADSVELVLVSPLVRETIDAAVPVVRAAWPGRVRLVTVASAPIVTVDADRALAWRTGRDDPLQATALRLGARASDSARVRIDRVEGAAIDSAFVSAGGVQLLWPARTTTDSATGALVRGVVVAAPLARRTVDTTARAIGWFADGRVAVTERAIGTGCVRDVGVLVPTAGDLAITPRFVALLDALRARCGDGTDLTPITTEERRALITAPAATVAPALAALPSTGDTRLMRALLGAAAALLLLELPLRQRRATA